MLIAPAVPSDLDTLITFRNEAARWLAARGIDQWSSAWPSEDVMAEGMLRNIRAGETFILWDEDGTPAATITVDRWANPDLWGQAERAEPALYTHKLTVARAYAGRGLGAKLLDWAGSRAARSGGRWLRCLDEQRGVAALLLASGFHARPNRRADAQSFWCVVPAVSADRPNARSSRSACLAGTVKVVPLITLSSGG